MFQRAVVWCGIPPLVSLLIAGCAGEVLPSFDGGVVNPDIRFLRVGDVMTSVKCAMDAFLQEREEQLIEHREQHPESYSKIEADPSRGIYFDKYAINSKWARGCPLSQHRVYAATTGPAAWQTKCVPNNCNPLSKGFWDYSVAFPYNDDRSKQGQGKCAPVPDYSSFALDPNQSAGIAFSLKAVNSGFINYQRIDANLIPGFLRSWITVGNAATGFPFPQLNPTLNRTTMIDFSTVIPQSLYTALPAQPIFRVREVYAGSSEVAAAYAVARDARLSVDDKELAKSGPQILDEALSGAKDPKTAAQELERLVGKSVKFSAARARSALDDLSEKSRAALEDISKNPSKAPASVETARKASDQLLAVDQRIDEISKRLDTTRDYFKQIPNPSTDVRLQLEGRRLESLANDIEKYTSDPVIGRKVIEVASATRNAAAAAKNPKVKSVAVAERPPAPDLSAPAKRAEAQIKQRGGYESRQAEIDDFRKFCQRETDTAVINDTTSIDYLAIKRLLHNVVDRQNKALYQGAPSMTLDQLKLTTTFEMTLEMQAGTKHIFRIVPLVAPPNTDFKLDHTHSLVITLHGLKRKGEPGLASKLLASCRERIQLDKTLPGGVLDANTQCEQVGALLLEAIIEKLETGSSSGATAAQ